MLIPRAAGEDDLEFLRQTRNLCREWMTRDTRELQPEDQLGWWSAPGRGTPFLYLVEGRPAGFGLITHEDGRNWLTGGLHPDYRGQGYGKQLFQHLLQECGGAAWLEVRETNTAALGLYRSLGFRERMSSHGIMTMERCPVPLFQVTMSGDAAPAAARVIGSGYLGMGPEVAAFEREFAAVVAAPELLATSSCTAALQLALHLCGVGPGDEVIAPPLSCAASFVGIQTRGARIVWADLNPETGNVDPADVGRKITQRTKAVLAVDWAGRPCDYEWLRYVSWFAEQPIPIIQDAAHSLLARYGNQPIARTGGDLTCYSVGPIKHLSTPDGGFLHVAPQHTERAKRLRWYGLDRDANAKFRFFQDLPEAGYKFIQNDVNAAIGRANLPYVAGHIERCRANAAYYDTALQGFPGVQVPPPDPGASWWLYPLLVEDRDSLITFLEQRGIATSPAHTRCDTHTGFPDADGPLPGTDYYTARHVCIPVHAGISDEDRAFIATAIWRWAHP